jgi:hypothetical protein
MTRFEEIEDYVVYIASYPKQNEWKANIYLRKQQKCVVDLRFVDRPSDYASQQQIVQIGASVIYDHINQLPIYLDILRNEKPIFVNLIDIAGNPGAKCILQTSGEPVGEAEKAASGLVRPTP